MIGRYEPSDGTFTFHGAAPDVNGPFDIKATHDAGDGCLWFTNKSGNSIGRIDTR